ncbi:MAG: cbb3-type cytochrome c oxidase subunit 3 [Magnetococcales bacterium]|nr:cbb3-type cytochrome c oxidase subunit 3 [Magnetococcales bacterium]
MTFDQWLLLSKQVALVIFFITFVGVVVWAFWPGHRQRFEQQGRRLLEEEEGR